MKRLKVVIFINIVLFVCTATIAYAYFSKNLTFDSNNAFDYNPSENINSDDTTYYEFIDDIYDFYSSIRIHNDYKDTEKIQVNQNNKDSTHVKTLVLNTDLILTADAIITADCHLYLNGKNIDLNGYSLQIRNVFDGTMLIYGEGKIYDISQNSIIIDEKSNVYFGKDVYVSSDVNVEYENASPTQVVNSAMNYILSNISNGVIEDFYSIVNINDKCSSVCDFTHSNNIDTYTGGCIYTYTDLDLIYNYFTYDDLIIKYTVPTNSCLTKEGEILDNSITAEVSLNISVSYLNATLEKTVCVHIVNEADYAKASYNVLMNHLQKYYVPEKNINNEIIPEHYSFLSTFLMPKKDYYFNVEYLYTLNTNITEDIDDYFEIKENEEDYIYISLNDDITSMEIIAKDTSNTYPITPISIAVKGDSQKTIEDNYSYAVSITNQMFGNQISIHEQMEDDLIVINGYNGIQLLRNHTINGYNRLDPNTYIKYELVDDSGNVYSLEDSNFNNLDEYFIDSVYRIYGSSTDNYWRLGVNSGMKPNLNQLYTLNVIYTFKPENGDSEVIKIPRPIVYVPIESGDGFDSFMPYYVYFNNQFDEKTNGYTYNDFFISLAYSNRFPTYAFLVYEEDSMGNVTRINTNNGLYDINVGVEGDLAKIDTLSYEKLNDIVLNNLSYTYINIDPYKINKEDTKYHFVYVPIYKSKSVDANGTEVDVLNFIFKYNDGTQNYNFTDTSLAGIINSINTLNINTISQLSNYEYISEYTVPGIVRHNITNYNNEEFTDSNLYHIVYDILYDIDRFDDEGNNICTYTSGDDFILTKDLSKYISSLNMFELMDNYQLDSFTSLKGINLLTGVDSITFENIKLGLNKGQSKSINDDFINSISYISQMSGLTNLNLKNTGSYDRTSSTLGFPTGTDNNFLQELSNLTNLRRLNLANNAIYDFTDLQLFSMLEWVDVSNNTFTCTLFGFALIDNLIGAIVNNIYGSGGVTNLATFTILQTTKNVEFEGIGKMTDDKDILKIIYGLTSLEYQDKLYEGISITNIYKDFGELQTDGSCAVTNSKNPFGFPVEKFDYVISSGDDEQTVYFVLNSISFVNSNGADTNGTSTYFTLNVTYDIEYNVGTTRKETITFTYDYEIQRIPTLTTN